MDAITHLFAAIGKLILIAVLGIIVIKVIRKHAP